MQIYPEDLTISDNSAVFMQNRHKTPIVKVRDRYYLCSLQAKACKQSCRPLGIKKNLRNRKIMRKEIERWVAEEVVPRYAEFDAAHREDHAVTVIGQAMRLLDTMPEEYESGLKSAIDREMLLVAAACHDLGLVNGRENHHTDSGRIIRATAKLREWFDEEQIEIIAQAAEDHRASGAKEPRSIYGKIVAEADRVIEPDTIIRRTIQFGLANYPQLGKAGHIERAVRHLKEKYGREGYLKLWIPWSDNAERLVRLQNMIDDPDAIRAKVSEILNSASIK